jgi:photosystem II stability/assembly factor-like uncharacterized protein
MTFDGGATYGHKIFNGHGTKAVADISFINEHVGVLVANTAAPVGTVYHSVDGGHTWNAVDVPANLGLNACVQADLNRAYIVGKVDAGGAPAVMYVNGA